jgi:hypothetical protein
MSEDAPHTEDAPELTPTARVTRDTLLGCLGLFCVLLTLPLLWLAVGAGSGWLAHVLPLLAFAAAIGGAALTLRVPAGGAIRSSDPQRPLTHAGSTPSIERPATRANRLAWALSAALTTCALGGYALEVIRTSAVWGLTLMLGAGLLLLAQGLLVGGGRLPAPALRWLRLTIYGGAGRQSAPLIAVGFVTMAGALFLALLDGYRWGPLGLALLVVTLALIAPFARRMPRRPGPLRTINRSAGRPE